MVAMVAMVAMWDEAILELEEPVSTKVIALETTVAKAAIKTTVVKLEITAADRTTAAKLAVKPEVIAAEGNPVSTLHTCIHC